jgi:hypothetical protein
LGDRRRRDRVRGDTARLQFLRHPEPFGQVDEEQLAPMLEENLYKLFEYVEFSEEGENVIGGMDTWYGFFSGYVNGQEVGAMVSVLNTACAIRCS